MALRKKKSAILKNRAKQSRTGLLMRIFRWIVWLAAGCAVVGAIAASIVYFILSEDLPKITSLSDYHPPIITTIYSDDNRKVAEFFKERRIVIPISDMPEMLLQAFVAAEDDRFYIHKGVDLVSIVRAFFKNLEAGAIVQGGSTITQQVTKSLLLSPERSYQRKIKEAILAYRIDKTLTKDDILHLYLNQIYLGHGAYGVEAAAENYFGKSAKNMNLAECAMLAGLPQAPSRYSPFKHPERAKQRQIYVLNRMVAVGYITNLQATEAINTELDIKPRRNWYIEEIPYYTEHIRRYIEKTYGKEVLYNEGLEVHTAVNIEMQKTARAQIEEGLRALDKRQGYRGPLEKLSPTEIETYLKKLRETPEQMEVKTDNILKGVVVAVDPEEKTVAVRMAAAHGVIALSDMRWARQPNLKLYPWEDKVTHPEEVLSMGDVVLVKLLGSMEGMEDGNAWQLALEQTPAAQSALVCIEAGTGLVKAMVGGRDFRKSQFNRAIQSRRQPGSTFKSVIYTAALNKGYTPASVVIDSAVVYDDAERNFKWKPDNFSEKFYGPTLLRDALTHSRNIISIKLLMDIGIEYTIEWARKLGITSPLSHDLSIALGSSGVSPLEIATVFFRFCQ